MFFLLSLTTPNFHGNTRMLRYVLLFAYAERCSHKAGGPRSPDSQHNAPCTNPTPIPILLPQQHTRTFPPAQHEDRHYCLFPSQELILNLAVVSILIPPPPHFWKHLLNH